MFKATICAPQTFDQVELLQSAADSWKRQLARAQTRAAEVDTATAAQPWEVEQSCNAVAAAQNAVDLHAAFLAVARHR